MAKTGLKPIDELVRRAIIGDGTAFTALWDTNIDSLKLYLKSLLKNMDDFYIDDICSRSFEKAFRQISSYDPSRSQFPTWLKKIAHNTALDVIKAESKTKAETLALGEAIEDEIDSPLDSIIRCEDELQTTRYIDALPELYREIARKRLIDGMQYKEIAEADAKKFEHISTGNVTVIGGVTIGDNVTIGAGSVVVKDLPSTVTGILKLPESANEVPVFA